MLLALILICVDFYEEYKLRPDRILFNIKCRNQNSPRTQEILKLNYKHEGNRTLGFQNRNLMLYPLSYMLLVLKYCKYLNNFTIIFQKVKLALLFEK